jgi:hypothetical protein
MAVGKKDRHPPAAIFSSLLGSEVRLCALSFHPITT